MNTHKNRKSFLAIVISALLMVGALPAIMVAADDVPAADPSFDYTATFGAEMDDTVNATLGQWPDFAGANIVNTVTFKSGQETTLTVDFGSPVKFGNDYAAIDTDYPATGIGQITSLKLDGTDYPLDNPAYIDSESNNGTTLRLTLCNKWNSDITAQPIDVATLPQFTKLEVTFSVNDCYTATFGAEMDDTVNAALGQWPDFAGANIVNTTTFQAGQATTLTVDFGSPVKFGNDYAAIDTDFAPTGTGEITSLKLDGTDYPLDNPVYIDSESNNGTALRLTLCNKWNGDITAQPIDVATLPQFTKLEITFTVNEGDGSAADTAPAPTVDPNFDYTATFGAEMDDTVNADLQQWPDYAGLGIVNTATFKVGQETTLTVDFGSPVKFGNDYAAIDTDFPPTGTGEITSLKLDGTDYPLDNPAYIDSESNNGTSLRLTLCNKWNGDITAQPIDVATLPQFTKLEITFTVNEGDGSAAATPAPNNIPAFDPNGTYHAYIGIQTDGWNFRNAWADTFYGANGTSWAGVTDGGSFNTMYNTTNGIQPGTFNDVEIAGNGTYTVSAQGFDFSGDTVFNQLFVSTDIPLANNPVSFSDVKVIMDGSTKSQFDGTQGNKAIVMGIDSTDKKDYYELYAINAWNADLGGTAGLFGYSMPKNTVAIQFTISGFNYDKAPDAATPAPTVAPTAASQYGADYVANNDDTSSGGLPVWGIVLICVGAVVVVAAVIIIVMVMKKKSGKKQ